MNALKQNMLSGFRILDLTRAVAGPSCTRMFAEAGAEVIKIESAPDGDMARTMSKLRNERSLYIIQQSLNKKSVCVDLRSPAGIEIVRELVPLCDVVVENFKPGMLAKMGLGYDVLKTLREDIILCSISALGQTGPLSHKPGYDYIAQAYSGITSMIGAADDAPYIPLAAVGDVSTGVTAAFAIAAALLDRSRSGGGQHLDIALLDCYYHYHEVNVHQYSGTNGDMEPTRGGRHMSYVAPGGVFRGVGGCLVIMAFLHHWRDLCAAMGKPELIDDPQWSSDPARVTRKDEVVALIEQWLQTFPDVDSAIAQLEAHNVPCAPVLTVAETTRHPHLLERGTVRTVHDRVAGEFQIPGHPVRSSRYPDDPGYTAPLLGEHNREILSGLLGKSEGDIAALEQAGVLNSKAV